MDYQTFKSDTSRLKLRGPVKKLIEKYFAADEYKYSRYYQFNKKGYITYYSDSLPSWHSEKDVKRENVYLNDGMRIHEKYVLDDLGKMKFKYLYSYDDNITMITKTNLKGRIIKENKIYTEIIDNGLIFFKETEKVLYDSYCIQTSIREYDEERNLIRREGYDNKQRLIYLFESRKDILNRLAFWREDNNQSSSFEAEIEYFGPSEISMMIYERYKGLSVAGTPCKRFPFKYLHKYFDAYGEIVKQETESPVYKAIDKFDFTRDEFGNWIKKKRFYVFPFAEPESYADKLEEVTIREIEYY